VTFFGFEIRRPQVYGGLLLLALAAKALLAAYQTPLSAEEARVLNRSVEIAVPIKSEFRQPVLDSILLYRITRLFEPSVDHLQPTMQSGQVYGGRQADPRGLTRLLPMLYRLPFVVFGLWLGGALWWVSRRLFNNEGGYAALALFCFSPLVVRYASTINPEIIAAWGLFGIVYTAIGVGHTLYSPPRRWPPRIVLLGLAFGFTAAAHLGAAVLGAVLAIFFLLYLAPADRRSAALAVLAMAFIIACLFVWSCYAGGASFRDLLSHATETIRPVLPRIATFTSWFQMRNLPTLVLVFLAFVVFLGWRRTRYFGNWTPLLVIALLGAVQFQQTMPAIWIAPFVYVFAGGIVADLLESNYRRLAQITLFALMTAQVALTFSLH